MESRLPCATDLRLATSSAMGGWCCFEVTALSSSSSSSSSSSQAREAVHLRARSKRLRVLFMLLLPAVPAVLFTAWQYLWPRGFNQVAEHVQCVCKLQGEQCMDAVLGTSR